MELSDKDLLNYAIENGIIDADAIRKKIEMNERAKYLEQHRGKIWQGKDNRYATYLPDEHTKDGRRLLKKGTKDDLMDAIVEFYKEAENEPYIKDVFYMWIDGKLKYGEILQQTYDRYETDFFRFFKNEKISDTKMRYITEDMLEDFIKTSIYQKKLTAKSWGNLRTLINGIFKFSKKKGYTKISITQFMGDLEISPKSFRRRIITDEESVFTNNEVDKVVSYIMNNELTLINLGIVLAFQSGLRAGELSALKYSDLDGNILNVNKTEIRYKDKETRQYIFEVRESTKGREGCRKVILTESAIRTIRQARRMNPFGEYLFMHDGTRIKGKAFTVKLEKICRYVGIEPRSLHKVRKTYGTKLLNAGIDEKLIEKQMGHTDIRTTKGYYYFNNREIAEAQELITAAMN